MIFLVSPILQQLNMGLSAIFEQALLPAVLCSDSAMHDERGETVLLLSSAVHAKL